jgi:hypothetical protein
MATLDRSNTSNPGGPDATLVFTTNATENMGLQDTIADRFVPDKSLASKADLIALGGVISVKHCGGPDIPFRGGRMDVAPENVILGNTQRIPGGNEAYPSVKAKMIRMGFSPVDIAVLGGVFKPYKRDSFLISHLCNNSHWIPYNGGSPWSHFSNDY